MIKLAKNSGAALLCVALIMTPVGAAAQAPGSVRDLVGAGASPCRQQATGDLFGLLIEHLYALLQLCGLLLYRGRLRALRQHRSRLRRLALAGRLKLDDLISRETYPAVNLGGGDTGNVLLGELSRLFESLLGENNIRMGLRIRGARACQCALGLDNGGISRFRALEQSLLTFQVGNLTLKIGNLEVVGPAAPANGCYRSRRDNPSVSRIECSEFTLCLSDLGLQILLLVTQKLDRFGLLLGVRR